MAQDVVCSLGLTLAPNLLPRYEERTYLLFQSLRLQKPLNSISKNKIGENDAIMGLDDDGLLPHYLCNCFISLLVYLEREKRRGGLSGF